nr:hypothetical protein [Tanacetum cinerariifolium]
MRKLIAELPTLTTHMKDKELMVYLSTANEEVSVVLLERNRRQMPICNSIAARRGERLAKWAVDLGTYDVTYAPRNTIKSKVIADFLADTMIRDDPNNEETVGPKKPSDQKKAPESSKSKEKQMAIDFMAEADTWKLYTDGASNDYGSSAGLILIDLEGMEYSYALRLNFNNSNNDIKYEALLAGLRITVGMKVEKMHTFVDSKLVANQVSHIPREENKKVDALKVNMIVEEERRTWMTPIREYIENSALPEDPNEARTIREKDKIGLDTSTKLTWAKLNKRSGDADLSKDKTGPKLPLKFWRSWYVEGHIRSGVISSVLVQRYLRETQQRYNPYEGPQSLSWSRIHTPWRANGVLSLFQLGDEGLSSGGTKLNLIYLPLRDVRTKTHEGPTELVLQMQKTPSPSSSFIKENIDVLRTMIKEHDQQAKMKATPRKLAYIDSDKEALALSLAKGFFDRFSLESFGTSDTYRQTRSTTGSESRAPMLNKENYVPWSSRLLRYAKSRPNGKLIHNSILNGPYVRRMIPEPGDVNRDVNVTETFHLQTDDELSDKEIKQIEADDQAIQTILFGLPEDIYAAVDSCETAQEIWL